MAEYSTPETAKCNDPEDNRQYASSKFSKSSRNQQQGFPVTKKGLLKGNWLNVRTKNNEEA